MHDSLCLGTNTDFSEVELRRYKKRRKRSPLSASKNMHLLQTFVSPYLASHIHAAKRLSDKSLLLEAGHAAVGNQAKDEVGHFRRPPVLSKRDRVDQHIASACASANRRSSTVTGILRKVKDELQDIFSGNFTSYDDQFDIGRVSSLLKYSWCPRVILSLVPPPWLCQKLMKFSLQAHRARGGAPWFSKALY